MRESIPQFTRVSVIVPVFNRERYVKECVESVLATSYPNLEILIVEDGSTDGSPAILENIHSRNANLVRLIRHPGRRNQGPWASRNLALSTATGAYVCFLDSDDVMLPHRFEKAVMLLDGDSRLDGVVEVTELFFEDDVQRARWGTRSLRYGPGVDSIPSNGFLSACLLENTCSMHMANIFVRRRLFAKSGVFRPSRERSEDFHLWLRMAACGEFAVGESRRSITRYRRHSKNIWMPDRRDSVRDLGVLSDVLAWARRSADVSPANLAVLKQAYRRKAMWCLAMLNADRERRALWSLARALLRADSSWAVDRAFLGNLTRGLLGGVHGASRGKAGCP